MNKEILNINDKGEYHGYQEWHYNNEFELRGNYKNDGEIGYLEWHDGKITTYYIK